MRTILIISTLIFTLISCEKTEREPQPEIITNRPEIPKNDSIDINLDGVTDFVIIYREIATGDIPSSGGSIIGSILTLDQNQVLYRPQTGNLFLQSKDTIKNENNSNSYWLDYDADIVKIDRTEYTWNSNWQILSEHTSEYYIGVKLISNDIENIGWMLTDIDTVNGKVSILESKLTDSTEIILD